MGIFFRNSKKINKNTHINYTKSGASVTRKFGPLSVNSRGNVSLRLGKGISARKKLW